ncbi:MAG: phasin family protein [Hyphomicrobiaceae bacterium]|nr:phasin family protein [Hyphomicrobiaceae bacterium]
MDFNPAKGFEDMQKLNQQTIDTTMKVMSEWQRSWQAIAAEMTDYTKRSFEEGTATMEKLMAAKSMEQAFEIQSSYAKRSYDEYMQQMTKVGGMYANLAKEAGKPMEKMFQFGR